MAKIPDDTYQASNASGSKDAAVLILTADNVQDLEFFYPYYRFVEEGFKVDVVTPEGGAFKGKMGMGLSQTTALAAADELSSYDLLYIPGGKAPEKLKNDDLALQLVRRFAETGKPIAAICHGPQVLAAAGLIDGRRIAAWPEVEKEVEAAGGEYVNEPTVVDGQFITARWPGDLPMHVAKTLEALNKSKNFSGKSKTGTPSKTMKEAV